MRYGILSDIHGNLEALEAVLELLVAGGASAFLCLGDVVGYGADPNACCERVAALPSLECVAGNHDLAAIGAFDLGWFNDTAREALEWTARALSPASRQFLAGLPERARGPGYELAHGSPANPVAGYVAGTFEAMAGFDAQIEPVCFVGHTHVPAAYARRSGRLLCSEIGFPEGQPLMLMDAVDYMLNCGGVGQPRDGDPRAACGIYDSEARSVTPLRVSYPVQAAQARIRAAGLPAALAERLARGR